MSKGAYEITGTVSPWLQLPALGGLVLGRQLRGRPGERRRPPRQPPRHGADGDRRGRGARRRPARLPVGGLRRRGPGRRWTAMETSSSPTASSTTSSSSTPAPTRPTTAASRAPTPSGRAPQAVDPAEGGYPIAGTGLKVFNFTTQAEDAGAGVIAHEYGHDLGLPDLYDVIGPGGHRRRLVGPDEHRLPQRTAVPDDPRPHGRLEQVRARLDRPPGAASTAPPQANVVLGQASRPPAGTRRRSASTCPTSA